MIGEYTTKEEIVKIVEYNARGDVKGFYEGFVGYIPIGYPVGPNPRLWFEVESSEVTTDWPVLPFKYNDEIKVRGWDIGIPFVVDAKGVCWLGGGHGEALSPTEPTEFVEALERLCEGPMNWLREEMGMPVKEPAWCEEARQMGWTPPTDWNYLK